MCGGRYAAAQILKGIIMSIILTNPSGSGGGGGGGDASAANQLLEIAELEDINLNTANSFSALNSIESQTLTISGAVSGTEMQVDIVAALPAGENFIGVMGGVTANPTANFTRPADTTAYASGDLVANSTTAGSVVPMTLTVTRVAAGSCILRKIKLHKSGTSTTNASFRVHFFRAAPATITNGDNGVFSVSGVADYIGAMDVSVDRAFTDGAAGFGTPVIGSEMSVKLASGSTIVALIEARAAYTPGNAEVFTVTLEDFQD